MKSKNIQHKESDSLSKKAKANLPKEKSLYKKLRLKHKETQKGKRNIIAIAFLSAWLYLCIYLLSWLIAPSISLTAKIKAIDGGYSLSYDICTLPFDKFNDDIEVGDIVHIDNNFNVKKTRRKSIDMRIESINNDHLELSFVPHDVPVFLSTDDFLSLVKTSQLDTRFVNSVKVSGKIISNRFITSKIEILP